MAKKEKKTEENNESKEAEKKPKKSSSSGDLKGLSIFGKIVCVGVIIWLVSISYYAFAFFLLSMLPSILSIIIDRGSGRFASKTVSACNFIAVIPHLFNIGLAYEKDITAKQLMADPTTWFVIYSFSAIGWMMIWILPNLTLILITARADMKTKKLMSEQKKILDEWGAEVKTGKPRKSL
jgi:hypothetical protein